MANKSALNIEAFKVAYNYSFFRANKKLGFTFAANRFALDADIDTDAYGGALD